MQNFKFDFLQKEFLEKKPKKIESVINTCVSLIKQHGKRWQKFHKNVILSLGGFKILYEEWNCLLETIMLLD